MKISEVRSLIEKYSADQLMSIIPELYKAIPQAVKEGNDIDSILKDPQSLTQSKLKTRQKIVTDIELLTSETEDFIDYTYKQYYFTPQQIRFQAKPPEIAFFGLKRPPFRSKPASLSE